MTEKTRSFRGWAVVLTAAVMLAAVSTGWATPPFPGDDAWYTPCGGAYDDFSSNPIPAGFFDPGSDPFTGVVYLTGGPLGIPIMPFPAPGVAVDTVVRRFPTSPGFTCGSPPEMVPIEIVALNLVSCSPVTVTYFGGGSPEFWDISVCLSPPQMPGSSMVIRHECMEGGTFTSTLNVSALVTFTRAAPPATRMMTQSLTFTANGWWQHVNSLGFYVLPAGATFDSDCNGSPDLPTMNGPMPNFFPGVYLPGCVSCAMPAGPPRKIMTPEEEMLAAHGIFPPNQEKPQQVVTQACCLPGGGCVDARFGNQPPPVNMFVDECSIFGGMPAGPRCSQTICPGGPVTGACCIMGPTGPTCMDLSAMDCAAASGAYQGDGTNCVDTDCNIWINEMRIDQNSTDTDEFFELSGPPGLSLAGLTYVIIGDSGGATPSGVIERAYALGGAIPADGFWFAAGDANTCGAAADMIVAPATDIIENTDNLTHLLVTGFTGAVAQDRDLTDDCIIDAPPWTAILDCLALSRGPHPPEDCVYCPTVLAVPAVSGSPAYASRCEDCTGAWSGGNLTYCKYDSPGRNNLCGACCTGATCTLGSRAGCEVMGGTFQGDGTTCTPGACDIGACCLPESASKSYTIDVNPDQPIPDNGATSCPGTACPAGQTCGTYIGPPPGLLLTNRCGTTHTINVADSGIIGDLNVDIDLLHTFYGDVIVTVTHGATRVTLMDGDPADNSDLQGTYVLDDEAATTFDAAAGVAGSNLLIPQGSYIGQNPLSAFDGIDKQGPWTLFVADDAGLDTGTLRGWSLHFGNASPEVPCNELREAECTVQGGMWQGAGSLCGGLPDPCLACIKAAPAGDDCWSTPCGGGSQYDFTPTPIPAGFFYPGSDPFTGLVGLGGATGFADTIVRRLADMCFDGPLPACNTIPIQLIQLNLTSCMPITVTGSMPNQLWNVAVVLEGPQPPGQMTACKVNPAGGTFDTQLPVNSRFQFTPAGGGPSLLFPPPPNPPVMQIMQSVGLPWMQNDPLNGAIFCGPGGFFPGVDKNNPNCCDQECHSSFGSAPHDHCVMPPKCPKCPDPFCPLPAPPTNPVCLPRQATDCTTPVSPTDQCLPVQVHYMMGIPIADLCECITPGPKCGPIQVNNNDVCCPAGCPPPNVPGNCLVHINGASTGQTCMPGNAIPDGAIVDCQCAIATGACCGDGICTPNVTGPDCANMGGIYQGDGSVCTPGLCPQLGACCYFPANICQFQSQAACQAGGGVYQGDASDCLTVNCAGIPTVSQWGILVMLLLLASAGTIVFARRRALKAAT